MCPSPKALAELTEGGGWQGFTVHLFLLAGPGILSVIIISQKPPEIQGVGQGIPRSLRSRKCSCHDAHSVVSFCLLGFRHPNNIICKLL